MQVTHSPCVNSFPLLDSRNCVDIGHFSLGNEPSSTRGAPRDCKSTQTVSEVSRAIPDPLRNSCPSLISGHTRHASNFSLVTWGHSTTFPPCFYPCVRAALGFGPVPLIFHFCSTGICGFCDKGPSRVKYPSSIAHAAELPVQFASPSRHSLTDFHLNAITMTIEIVINITYKTTKSTRKILGYGDGSTGSTGSTGFLRGSTGKGIAVGRGSCPSQVCDASRIPVSEYLWTSCAQNYKRVCDTGKTHGKTKVRLAIPPLRSLLGEEPLRASRGKGTGPQNTPLRVNPDVVTRHFAQWDECASYVEKMQKAAPEHISE